jgi:predicted ATP-grasp superfamily ATP-dependent carboligase
MKNVRQDKNLPWACLLGDVSMVRALGRTGIPVAIATTDRSDKCTRSRFCNDVIPIPGWQHDPQETLSALTRWAATRDAKPVLFYQTDLDVVWLSRCRDRLSKSFRFVLPDGQLVEDLVDKARFYEQSANWGIPIPETRILDNTHSIEAQCADWNSFPSILKPISRTAAWHHAVGKGNKALHIRDEVELQSVLRKLNRDSGFLILQAAVSGGEENVVSYHAYVRKDHEIGLQFTGCKIRTSPRQYGLSTYLEITDDEEVLELGRSIVEKIDFHGVLKIDLKRDDHSGKLFVLEINPRFNLWHHPGTVAGVPIPEAVYWDCVDPSKAIATSKARPGVRWMVPMSDISAFGEYRDAGEISAIRWLYQLLTVDVDEGFLFSDLNPAVHDIMEMMHRRHDPDRTALHKS